jgi:hypothetical protein
MGLVLGVLALNAVFLAVGYALLLAVLPRGAEVSYVGVALLTGAAATGAGVFVAAIAGLHVGLLSLALVAALLAAAGIGAAAVWGRTQEPAPRAPLDGWGAVALAGLVCVLSLALVGGFRSSPWLDDSWGIWLPKGLALSGHGLDERLFAPNGSYVFFEVPDYPLWWSTVAALGVRFVGRVDARVLDAQLALLLVAFAGTVARLLWGRVRTWVLLWALLLVVASPELLRETQSGGADVPLGVFVASSALGGALWLARGDRVALVVAGACAAAALASKTEGAPEIALLLVLALVVGWGVARRRLPALVGAAGVAFASFVPWLWWREAHDVPTRVPLRDLLDPGFLADRTDRLGRSASALAGHFLDPTEWLLLVPLLLGLSLAGWILTRRALWLAPAAAVLLGYALLVWAYWAGREDVDYLIGTSAYRTVTAFTLLAGVLLAPLAELLLRQRRLPPRRERRDTLAADVGSGDDVPVPAE